MKTKRWLVGVVVLALFGIASVPARGADVHYVFLKEIPIGGDGGWDYLSVDASARRLYVPHAGKVIASVPIGQGVDARAFDPETRLVFSSCGDGTVTIAREDTPEKLTVVQTLATERGARTMALDPATHRIYLGSARFEPTPEQAPGAPRQRPKIVSGSFKILVYGMEKPAKP